MKTRYTIGLSALAFAVAAGGISTGVALAGDRSSATDDSAAASDIAKAKQAIAKHKADSAVRWAEAGVTLRPQVAEYRAVLGQAYLLAGRFTSARTALADALNLAPGDGKVALNLALTQIAEGDWIGARKTLDSNSGSIPVSDRGLAIALSGDPAGAVGLLLPAARQPGATPKLRQNLALAFALAGRWQDARVVAGMDLSPAEVDERLGEWLTFSRPATRYDQVASLLGVKVAEDPGQPVALALNATPVSPSAAATGPVDAWLPKVSADAPATVASAPAPVAPTASAVVAQPAAAPVGTFAAVQPNKPAIIFGPRKEVVQPLPGVPVTGGRLAPLIKAPAGAAKTAIVKPLAALSTPGASKVSVSKGNFYVQLGAYDNAGVARDGWARASRVYSGFAGTAPLGGNINVGGKSFYRLSVGGYDQASAKRVCSAYRAKGGACFVRQGGSDQVAAFGKR